MIMSHKINIFVLSLISVVITTLPLFAQSQSNAQGVSAGMRYDDIDRDAEDFVIASVLIADPGTFMYSVLGHACIRLQCPTYGLDYCYSYEAEDDDNKVLTFLSGNLKMGLYAIPTDEYCYPYREEGRGVYEYILNLPIETKRELWCVMDIHLAEGINLPYDYYHRGCAITIVDFVNEALGETVIVYDRSLYENGQSVKEIWNKHTKNALWVRFLCYFIGAGQEIEKPLVGDKQLIIPTDLVHAWQQAKVNGEPLLASEPTILVAGEPQVADTWFTPMVLAIMLLVLAVANMFWERPCLDWLLLILQTIIGCIMVYLIVFSNLCCTSWNWLIIPFNPLPAICWKWRQYWALPYSGILMLWCLFMAAMNILGQVLVDWSHVLLVLAWIFIIFKQKKIVGQLCCNSK